MEATSIIAALSFEVFLALSPLPPAANPGLYFFPYLIWDGFRRRHLNKRPNLRYGIRLGPLLPFPENFPFFPDEIDFSCPVFFKTFAHWQGTSFGPTGLFSPNWVVKIPH